MNWTAKQPINILVLKLLMALFVTVSMSACGEKEFRFDPISLTCKNKIGTPGFNEDYVGECGHVLDKDLSGKNLSGEDLRGFHAENVILKETNFDQSSLEGARIISKSADFSSFRGASLQNVAIIIENKSPVLYSDAFTGARLNSNSIFVPFHFESLVESGARLVDVSPYVVPQASDGSPLRVELDSKMSETEAQIIRGDLMAVGNFSIQAPSEGLFATFFEGTESVAVLDYLNQSLGSIYRNQNGSRSPDWVAVNRAPEVFAHQPKYLTSYLLALIHGGWDTGIHGDVYDKLFAHELNGKLPTSVGVLDGAQVRIEGGYLSMTSRVLDRVSVLVHEARHSYCPDEKDAFTTTQEQEFASDRKKFNEDGVGLLNDILEYKQGMQTGQVSNIEWTELQSRAKSLQATQEKMDRDFIQPIFSQSICGYSHVNCPADFEIARLRGGPACEEHLWGASFVSGIYSTAIAFNCENCLERDRQAALAMAIDSLYRVLSLEKVLSLDQKTVNVRHKSEPGSPRKDSI